MKNIKKLILLTGCFLLVMSLSGCKKKVCTTQACIGSDCMEIEVDCDSLNENNDPTPTDTPIETPDIQPPDVTDNPDSTDNPDDPNVEETPNIPTPPENQGINGMPSLVPDPGFDYSGLLDVEQAAVNVFQAIIDGDCEGLLDMIYVQDYTFVTLDNMNTYFQISEYGSLKGRTVTIQSAKAQSSGYNRKVTIEFVAGVDEKVERFDANMILFNGKWKFVEDGFVGIDWQFKTTTGVQVSIDGKPVSPTGGTETQSYYTIKNISKVEHEFKYTYNGETVTNYIVPYTTAADYIVK